MICGTSERRYEYDELERSYLRGVIFCPQLGPLPSKPRKQARKWDISNRRAKISVQMTDGAEDTIGFRKDSVRI